VEQAAARIWLHTDVVDLQRRMSRTLQPFRVRAGTVQCEQPVLAVERACRRRDPGFCHGGGKQTMLRSVAGVQPLDGGAGGLVRELHRSAREREGMSPSAGEGGSVKTGQRAHADGGAERAKQSRWMKAAQNDRVGVGSHANARHRLVPRSDRGEHLHRRRA
jgi:hypothetical protein